MLLTQTCVWFEGWEVPVHDIWNPWHGCVRASEGCDHCYMYTMDKWRGLDGSVVRRSKTGFDYPLQRRRDGSRRVRSGELIRVCMTSDFFLREADPWREEAWDVMRQRPDVKFFLLTKRPERVAGCLPDDWGSGWPNVILNVTAENQRRADERVPILLGLPAAHRGVMCAPLIGPVDLSEHLSGGLIEQVICGGENYEGARPCDFDWVRSLRSQCEERDVTLAFIETGTVFVKDGRTYHMPDKGLQSRMAYKSGMGFAGRPIEWDLRDPIGLPVPAGELYERRFSEACAECGSRLICNGCVGCGGCAPSGASRKTFV